LTDIYVTVRSDLSGEGSMEIKQSGLRWLWVSVILLFSDLMAKYFVSQHLGAKVLRILPFLNFRQAHNTGAAFSFLGQAGGWQIYFFSLIALVVSVILLYWLAKISKRDRLTAISLSLVLGGALGNMIDRTVHGYVIDFIDFHIGSWHYATFNIADCGVVVGCLLLISSQLFGKRQS
jgi:signal peptidase II